MSRPKSPYRASEPTAREVLARLVEERDRLNVAISVLMGMRKDGTVIYGQPELPRVAH